MQRLVISFSSFFISLTSQDIHRITAYNNICYFLHKSGDNAEAELWANVALSQYPNQPILWGNLCVALKVQILETNLFIRLFSRCSICNIIRLRENLLNWLKLK
jgi:hypothetical protein